MSIDNFNVWLHTECTEKFNLFQLDGIFNTLKFESETCSDSLAYEGKTSISMTRISQALFDKKSEIDYELSLFNSQLF